MVRCNLESPSPGTFAPKSGSLALTEHAEPATLLPSYHSCSSIHKQCEDLVGHLECTSKVVGKPLSQQRETALWQAASMALGAGCSENGNMRQHRHPKIGWFHKFYIYNLMLGNARNEAICVVPSFEDGECWHIPAPDSRGLLLMHAVHIHIFCRMDTLRVSRVKRKHNFFLAPFVYFYIFTFKVPPKKCLAF